MYLEILALLKHLRRIDRYRIKLKHIRSMQHSDLALANVYRRQRSHAIAKLRYRPPPFLELLLRKRILHDFRRILDHIFATNR